MTLECIKLGLAEERSRRWEGSGDSDSAVASTAYSASSRIFDLETRVYHAHLCEQLFHCLEGQ